MEQQRDAYGLEWTVSARNDLTQLESAVTSYLASLPDTPDILTRVTSGPSPMPMALAMQAALLKMSGDPRLRPALTEALGTLQSHYREMNARELAHMRALELWAAEHLDEATEAYEAILSEYPLDMLALRFAHYLHFYAGDAKALRDSVARVYPAWPRESPWHGYLDGMYAFGLEEAGDYAGAEAHGMAALAVEPKDIWAAHAVVHALYMTARAEEGLAIIERFGDWPGHTNFRFHMVWHEALLHMRGVDVGDRWRHLDAICEKRATDDELVFATLHYLIPPAMAGDEDTLRRGIDSIERWARRVDTQGTVSRDVGVAVAHSIAALSEQDLERTRALLEPALPELHRIGGSHAQREVFEELLLYACGD
ncbi:MAG: hypothetical protein CMD83_08480 [Gammaproteobacteria bacterium]|nr:hypothetical protein [Gammaproteobacteria bacterium]